VRRREPLRSDERPDAPLWIRQMNVGLRHVGATPGEGLGGPATRRWRQAQDDWCRENGCYRIGKTCIEIFGHPCAAGETRN
jgi:hypothetical protein